MVDISEDDADPAAASDEYLVALVRQGEQSRYAQLWSRHASAGLTVARSLGSAAEPEDLVSEAYVVILAAIQRGNGPTGAFRPYLFTTIRNLATRWGQAQTTDSIDDIDPFDAALAEPDPTMDLAERTITVTAFQSLPERWKSVLWYTEVEGMKPAETGRILGITANGAAALAYRAREGLRKAWLQAHINAPSTAPECQWVSLRVADHNRDSLPAAERERFDSHVAECVTCSILVEEIDSVASRLGVMILPLVIGSTAATGYLASLSGVGASVASIGAPMTSPRTAGRGLRTVGLTAAAVASALVIAGTVWGLSSLGSDSAPVAAPPAPVVAQPSSDEEPEPAAETVVDEQPLEVVLVGEEPPRAARPLIIPTVAPIAEPPALPSPLPPADAAAPPPIIVGPTAGVLQFAPALSGTAEPGATVTIHDELGEVGAVVADDDGEWFFDAIGVEPHDGQSFVAIQRDAAGRVSGPSTSIGAFTFERPSFATFTEGGTVAHHPQGYVSIEAGGVTGRHILMYIDGTTSGTLHLLDATTITRVTASDLPPGVHSFGLRYADAEGRLGAMISVTVTTTG